jgi:tetratricopeptide (TPR) repeat protein
LFRQHAQGKAIDEQELTALVRAVGFHTLTVELLAKTYKESWELQSVGEMATLLDAQRIDDDLLQEFVPLESTGEHVRTYKHLLQVFSLAKLNEAEIFILTQFAVLPTRRILGKDFLAYVGDEDKILKDTLKDLARKGWLAYDAEHRFEMHPLMQMILLKTLKPTLEVCYGLWDYFANLMMSEEVRANPFAYGWLIEVGEALAQHIDYEGDKKNEGVVWNRLYYLCELLGDYPRALECGKKHLRLRKESVGEQHPDYIGSLSNLGNIHVRLGNDAEALPLYQEALQKRKEVLGERHPHYLASLNNLAILYRNMGDYAEALPLYQEALQKGRKALGEQHPDYLKSLNNLAILYENMGNYAEALPLYQEALQKRKEVLGTHHPDYAQSLYNLGTFYAAQDKHREALPYLQEAYDVWRKTLGEEHPYTKLAKEYLDVCSARVGEG